jgi:membrane-associated phospholipid phosphatase
MLNALDIYVMRMMSSYSQASLNANKFIIYFLDSWGIKILPLVACLWFLHFTKTFKAKRAIVEAFLGSFFALVISRLIQLVSPMRLRPLHSGDPNFIPPLGVNPSILEGWTSFPSDHAALIFALSTAVWRASKPLGAACYAWSILVVCLPRIYVGYHYTSDILGGAAVGVLATLAVTRFSSVQTRLMPWLDTLRTRNEALFYTVFFVLSYWLATGFYDVQILLRGMHKLFS